MHYWGEYDVVVAGGGIAGVASAIEAARCGVSVALVEKTVLLGGLATTGLILVYLPLCDGNGTQVTFGIAEELLHLSLRYGPGEVPKGWREGADLEEPSRYRVVFNPASFALALDEVVEEAGIEVWLDTLVTRPMVENGRVVGLEVENKGGRGELRGRCLVDATGDADLAWRAGAPCVEGRNWLSLWVLEVDASDGGAGSALPKMTWVGSDANGRGQPGDAPQLSGCGPRDATEFVLAGRRLLRERYRDCYQSGKATRETLYPVTLPAMPQFRTVRRIVGRDGMRPGQAGMARADSIGLVADWRRAGPVWEIPYGALLPQGVESLVVAGRCLDAEGDAWEVARVIPPAALTGQAAGAAAALAVRAQTTPDLLDVGALQEHLRRRGVRLHLSEVGL
ncbi:MAG: FAD-dependent oxidoreductase [Anaerolineae bacterium]|nr:FAD-dependent oxidoreductase [Anaerolineae bacterium]